MYDESIQPQSPQYHVIVIRLWSETSGHSAPRWRFTLESTTSQARVGFTHSCDLLDELEVMLTTLVTEAAPEDQITSDSTTQSPAA